jgi:hypothetical protein
MDAGEMSFAKVTFGCAASQYVIKLVSDPEQVLSECHRVVKPGGWIIFVKHRHSETGRRCGGATMGGRTRPGTGPAPGTPVRAATDLRASRQGRCQPRGTGQGRAVRAPYAGSFQVGCGTVDGVGGHHAVTRIG